MDQRPFSITVIADYGPLQDLAFSEVSQSISNQMGDLDSTIKE